jgi:putative hemolysin
MPDLGPTDIAMLICLAPLLLASGFFSGSETALFGMSQAQRIRLIHSGTLGGRAVEALLAHPRMLLITVLLGNMVVNVLYFVITSVLMLRLALGAMADLGIALAFLLVLVLIGEVLPKIVANTNRTVIAGFVAPPLLAVHGLIAPIRLIVDAFIVSPLSRLTAPPRTPEGLGERDLRELLELSSAEGAIDPDERRMLQDVIRLGRKKVRDVMTPRVHIHAVPVGAAREAVIRQTREARLTKLPVYREDLDHIVGVLHVKRFLIEGHERVAPDLPGVDSPHFVPEIATLEHLLNHFRASPRQSAIVVDEYGGTAGIVSIEDVVEEIVGDIVGPGEPRLDIAREIEPGVWRLAGEMSLLNWSDRFNIGIDSSQASTLNGLIIERLGRPAESGDVVSLAGLVLEVEHAEGGLAVSVIQRPRVDPLEAGGPEEDS